MGAVCDHRGDSPDGGLADTAASGDSDSLAYGLPDYGLDASHLDGAALMAVRLANVTTDYLQRTTSLLPHGGDSTVCFWVKWPVVPAASTAYILMDAPGTYVDYVAIYAGTGNVDFESPGHDVLGTAPVNDTWLHLAWVQSGTTQRCYINGSLIGSYTYNRAAITVGDEYLGNDTFGAATEMQFAYCREWTAALTQTEIRAELASPTVVKTTSLYMDCPLTADILDISGLSHNWTQQGSATFVAGPTLLTNTTAATAIDITPPYGGTFKQSPLTALNPHVWFTYTAVTDDVVIGTWAFTSLAATNKPTATIWTGTPSALVHLTDTVDINNASNVPYSVPITPGTTYFWEVVNAGVDVSGNPDLIFSSVAQPVLDIARGDILVNDETFGFPVAAVDSATGAVKRHKVFSAGESVDTQPDGTMLAEAIDINGDPIGLQIWDANFTLLTTVAYPANFHSVVFHIVTSALGGWFISAKGADTTHTTVTKMASDGTLGTTWTLTHSASANPVGIGVAPDESVLYYAITGTANVPVQRWDLVNDIAMTDLTAGIATYNVLQDIVVLSDGTVVVGHKKTTVTRDSNVHAYSAAGALLHTYAFGTPAINRMCRALDDPTSFWVWLYPIPTPSDGLNRYVNVVVSDGSFATDFTVAQYERGNYAAAASATPSARFGPSFSCPMWIYPTTAPIPPGEPVDYIIRRERWWPHISSEQFRQFFSMLQVDLFAGNGITTGQGSDPLLEVDWSDDGGHTWSSIHFVQTGKIGAYRQRAILRRMGYSRDRVYRIAVSDPAQWIVVNGFLQAVLGSS